MDREFTSKELKKINSKKGLKTLLSREPVNVDKTLRYIDYERKLIKLQIELIKLQTWAIENGERIIVLFEGRDAAGKGGAIRRITERINPRHVRVIALQKPTEDEQTQWYFQRYIKQFPIAGEMILFNRSWYNRAILEPVNGFCSEEQYRLFIGQVNVFEKMIIESGIHLVKIYMSISKKEQAKRFHEIKMDPLKQWKMSPVDQKAQELWEDYTKYKQAMFNATHTDLSPWKVIKANRKTDARLHSISYLLSRIPYQKDIQI